MTRLLCRFLGCQPQKGRLLERTAFSLFTYERWTYECARCGRVMDVEWSSVTGDKA